MHKVLRVVLLFTLLAPSWATANERSFICTAKAAIGWEAKSKLDSVGRVEAENQWLLRPIDKIEIQFSDKEKEALLANYVLKLLGEDDVKGYCSYFITDDDSYEVADCKFLSEHKEDKGTLTDVHFWYIEQMQKEGLTYQRLNQPAFFSGTLIHLLSETIVAYEHGTCKSF